MRESRRGQPGLAQPGADDLQKITGIGPTLTARLAEAGIARYRDLAALTPERLAGLTRVSPEKIASQDWIGQAHRLAGDLGTESDGQQEYATFHVELLIDGGAVRRTKARHYQTDTEECWPGWDPQRLIAVIRGKAGLDAPPPPDSPAPAEPRPAAPAIRVDGPHPAEEGAHGTFRLADQPTAVRMIVRVGSGAVDFAAVVVADSLGDRSCHQIGAVCGDVSAQQPASLELTGPPLPQGMYRLEAAVAIFNHRHQPADAPLSRQRILGDLVHVNEPGS